jgi:hypothetical protein
MQRHLSNILMSQRTTGNVVAARHYGGKDVRFGEDARQVMLTGAKKMGAAVAVTLGPKVRLLS